MEITDTSDGSTVYRDSADGTGAWSTSLADGTYSLTVTKYGYTENTTEFTVSGSGMDTGSLSISKKDGYFDIYDGFEDADTSEWTVNAGSLSTSKTDAIHGVYGASADSTFSGVRAFPSELDGTFQTRYHVNLDSATSGNTHEMALRDSGGTEIQRIRADGGTWHIYDGSSWVDVGGDASANTAHTVTTEVNLKSDTFSLTVDGEELVADRDLANAGSEVADQQFTHSGVSASLDTFGTQGVAFGQFSGRVVSCPAANPSCDSPSGVQDGTVVEYYGVLEPSLNAEDPEKIREKANSIRDEMRSWDPEQVGYEPDMDLESQFDQSGSKYVAVHNPDAWGLERWSTGTDLQNPMVTVPAGEDVILSVWDSSDNPALQDGTHRQLPGTTDGDTNIVLEKLDYKGSVVQTTELNTPQTRESTVGADKDYVRKSLPRGFYRVSAAGSDFSYVIAVGSPEELSQNIRSDLKDDADQLTEQAKAVQDYMSDDVVVKGTTSTYTEDGERGHFDANVTPGVNTVAVQAYSPAADEYRIEDVQNASMSDLRDIANLQDYNESFYISPVAKDVKVPSNDARIKTVEVSATPYMDTDRFANKSEYLQDLFQNESFADAVNENLDLTDEDATELNERLTELKDQNSELQERYDELENQTGTDPDTREQIRLLQQSIQDLQGELEAGDPETGFTDGNVSATVPFIGSGVTDSSDLDADSVQVTAHFPNTGNSEPVSDEYVTVDDSLTGADAVQITDYPLPEGANTVTFSVTALGSDGEGIGNTKVPVQNPNFEGRTLDLDSVDVSTLSPGPSEETTLKLNPSDTSAKIQGVNATVDGPNGAVNVTGGEDPDTVQFTTDGAGNHYVALAVTDTDGNTWRESLTVKASDESTSSPAGVRIREGFTGTFAVVGSELDGGAVDTSSGEVQMTAVASSDSVPSSVHFYTSDISGNTDETTVRMMKSSGGAEPETARKHVKVFVHTAQVSEDAVAYRNGNQPLGVGSETEHGGITCPEDSEGCTLRSYTDGDGRATFAVNNHPNIIDRTIYTARTWIPVDVPFMVIIPDAGSIPDVPEVPSVPSVPSVPVPMSAPVMDAGTVSPSATAAMTAH